jgi:hypothetical protein
MPNESSSENSQKSGFRKFHVPFRAKFSRITREVHTPGREAALTPPQA